MLTANSFLDLPDDIIKNILSHCDQTTWIYLAMRSPKIFECSRNICYTFVDKFTLEYNFNSVFDCTKTTWTLFNKFHRCHDLPAIAFKNGSQYWLQNNEYHRNMRINDKLLPAIITQPTVYNDGIREPIVEYYLYGIERDEYGSEI